ncbi:MAG TPA: helix-turn-helix domain-containing protein, partial [Fibrobacteraceae bacterium]|nr:helix-turn-helix domain-containing protein [Fibrobacteraceae bacterium]
MDPMRRQEESVNASLKEKPFQKVLRIEALLRSGKSHTIEELAKHLGIDNRSVFRYLRRLEITGCQILAKPRNGRTKEYWIAALHTHTDLLSKLKRMDEAMTGGGIRKYHRLLQQTIAHLSSPTIVSGGRSFSPSGRMAAIELEIEPCFHLDHGPLAEYLPTGSLREMLMDKLLMAMRAHKVIKLSYNRVERSGAKLVHMEMEPYFLSLRVGKLYLIGVPRSASSSPPVSVVFQRIRMVTETGEEFAPNPRVQMDDFYKYC